MAKQPAVSDESLTRALSAYAGMVDKVLTDPERWLGADEDPEPSDAKLPRRALDAVRNRALGKITPASPRWAEQPVEQRVDWWVDRIGVSAGLAAATPRVAGALADRVPLQAALGASAAGLAVCAVAREHGIHAPRDWVPLLARVLFDRELSAPVATVPPSEQSEGALTAPDEDTDARHGPLASVGSGAQRAARTLWRLARAFLDLQHLLDERPRGGLVARTLGKLPVVGLAGGWLDERGGIRRAAKETAGLIPA